MAQRGRKTLRFWRSRQKVLIAPLLAKAGIALWPGGDFWQLPWGQQTNAPLLGN
jgi:hypothetical protein